MKQYNLIRFQSLQVAMLVNISPETQVKVAAEAKQIMTTIAQAHNIPTSIVWKIGTSTIKHTPDTNCPAALHTATANLILLQQHNRIIRRRPVIPKEIYPYILQFYVSPPLIVGIPKQPVQLSTEDSIPALQKNITPAPANIRIIPKIDNHTIQPAKHLRAYIKTNAKMIANPNAAKIYIQLFLMSLIKSPKQPELEALAKLLAIVENNYVYKFFQGLSMNYKVNKLRLHNYQHYMFYRLHLLLPRLLFHSQQFLLHHNILVEQLIHSNRRDMILHKLYDLDYLMDQKNKRKDSLLYCLQGIRTIMQVNFHQQLSRFWSDHRLPNPIMLAKKSRQQKTSLHSLLAQLIGPFQISLKSSCLFYSSAPIFYGKFQIIINIKSGTNEIQKKRILKNLNIREIFGDRMAKQRITSNFFSVEIIIYDKLLIQMLTASFFAQYIDQQQLIKTLSYVLYGKLYLMTVLHLYILIQQKNLIFAFFIQFFRPIFLKLQQLSLYSLITKLSINIFYNYIMGCMKSTDGSQKPQNAIIMQVNKMKIIFQQEQNKFESKAKEKFSQFQTQIQKPIKQRNKDIQKIKLQEVVIFKNKRHICNILENDCIKIIDNKHLIGNQKYFETIAPNVKQILFAQSILHDENITSFKMMIYKKYPDVTQSQIQDIKSDIMKHHKVQQFPTHKMVNDFVLLSCRQNQMDLAKINASGNQFRYGV